MEYISELFSNIKWTKAFFYPFFISLGIFFAREVVNATVKYLQRKWFSSHERNAEDIRELHTKVHDRLCDLYVIIKLNEQRSDFSKIKQRLHYNAARLRKHDKLGKLISDDIDKLVSSLTYSNDRWILSDNQKPSDLVEKIRDNLDKLWRDKC